MITQLQLIIIIIIVIIIIIIIILPTPSVHEFRLISRYRTIASQRRDKRLVFVIWAAERFKAFRLIAVDGGCEWKLNF